MIEYLHLGRVGYDEGLRLQAEIAGLVAEGRAQNVLLLLEHPPVLTLGRNANRANILASDEMLKRRGVTVHEINRGGDVTYHGPGQLVGYPIFDLRTMHGPSGGRMGPVDFVRGMEEALIRLCGEFGVRAGRLCGLTGVWCGGGLTPEEHPSGAKAPVDSLPSMYGLKPVPFTERSLSSGSESMAGKKRPGGRERKIGAIGIHVARGITSHGFAFNVTTELKDFALIVPCGIPDHAVTSLAQEVQEPGELPTLEAIAQAAARQFGQVFGEQVVEVESLDALRAEAAAASAQFPAEDTPLQVPVEVERLHGKNEQPIRV
ncbi:MAG: lipoyl(octanoyl) transferase [Terracidiphilus sp.]|jgi:lipoyl(octanoyl) transferase